MTEQKKSGLGGFISAAKDKPKVVVVQEEKKSKKLKADIKKEKVEPTEAVKKKRKKKRRNLPYDSKQERTYRRAKVINKARDGFIRSQMMKSEYRGDKKLKVWTKWRFIYEYKGLNQAGIDLLIQTFGPHITGVRIDDVYTKIPPFVEPGPMFDILAELEANHYNGLVLPLEAPKESTEIETNSDGGDGNMPI